MKKIIVLLRGGLGNQIFQLLAVKTLSLYLKREACYCSLFLDIDQYGRELEVAHLASHLCISRVSSYIPLMRSHWFFESELLHPTVFTSYSPLLEASHLDIVIVGYFQDYNLIHKDVFSEFQRFVLDTSNHSIPPSIPKPYMCIHLRELHGAHSTNYINPPIDSLSPLYYRRAFDHFLGSSEVPLSSIQNALVFSDMYSFGIDRSKLLPVVADLCKANGFNLLYGDQYVKKPMEILSIMASAQLNIISNSTLSWLGSYASNSYSISPIMGLWEPGLRVPSHWIQIFDGNYNPITHSAKVTVALPSISSSLISSLLTSATSYLPSKHLRTATLFYYYYLNIRSQLRKTFKA